MTLLNTQNLNLYHLIGIIEYFAIIDLIDLISIIDTAGITGGVIAHIGIETKCGMIGYGDIHLWIMGWVGLIVGATIVGVVTIGTHLMGGTTTTVGITDMVGTMVTEEIT